MKRTITKGSPGWRELFYDNDVTNAMTPAHDFDSVNVLGDISALLDQDRPKVLVVGTRDAHAHESAMVGRIIEALSRNPWKPVVISGLALGTDTFVHRSALEHGLATVAVLPNGVGDDVYPRINRELAEQIASTPGCALLSQFPDGTAPMAVNFILRNKTMTMISDIAVIVATKEKGGSMICARMMDERNRRVFAVPGRPDDIRSRGCNELISQGVAEIYTESHTVPFLQNLCVMRKSNEYFY